MAQKWRDGRCRAHWDLVLDHDNYDDIPDLITHSEAEAEESSRQSQAHFFDWPTREDLPHRFRQREERRILETITVPQDKHASTIHREQPIVYNRGTKSQHKHRSNVQTRQLYGAPVRRK